MATILTPEGIKEEVKVPDVLSFPDMTAEHVAEKKYFQDLAFKTMCEEKKKREAEERETHEVFNRKIAQIGKQGPLSTDCCRPGFGWLQGNSAFLRWEAENENK